MKKLLNLSVMKKNLFILLLLSPSFLFAQSFEKVKKSYKGFHFFGGYHQGRFLNGNFGKALKDGNITQDYGFNVGGRLILFPFIIDMSFLQHNYNVKNTSSSLWNYGDTTKIRQLGLETSLSIPLFMGWKPLLPYAGVGYQSTILGVDIDGFGKPKNKNINSSIANTPTSIWKVGFFITPSEFVRLFIEYKQSLDLKDEFAIQQLNLSISFKVPGKK